jgi:hypothetical protein
MDISQIKALLDYNPATGEFAWKPGGRRAGTAWSNGYTRIRVRGKYYYAHRLAFAFVHDYWPVEVDHANGQRQDNRIENLRECTRQQNQWNARKRGVNPTSVCKGVHWNKQKRKWQARLHENYKHQHLGFFDSEEDAGQAYLTAASQAAGEFARSA